MPTPHFESQHLAFDLRTELSRSAAGDSDFASQLRIRSCPGRRWWRQGLWERLAGAPLEGSCKRMAETFGVEAGQLTDQDEVEEMADQAGLRDRPVRVVLVESLLDFRRVEAQLAHQATLHQGGDATY